MRGEQIELDPKLGSGASAIICRADDDESEMPQRSRPDARFPGIRDVRERLRTGRLWFWEPELID